MANCAKCGARLKKDARFCTECGTVVGEPVAEAVEVVTETAAEVTQTVETAAEAVTETAEVVTETAEKVEKKGRKAKKQVEEAAEEVKAAVEPVAEPAPAPVQPAPVAPVQPEPATYVPVAAPAPAPAPAPVLEISESALPKKFRPLKTGGWMFMIFFMAIPVIGWIYTLVCALSKGVNRNRRNYCRAVIYWFLIGLLLLIILAVVGYFVFWRNPTYQAMIMEIIEQIKNINPVQ